MKEVVIKHTDKEPIVIIITDAELELAKNLGLSDRQYIEEKVRMTLNDELKEKNT